MKVITSELRLVATVARKNHWGIRLAEPGPMPTQSIFKDGWWYEPLTQESTLPEFVVKRKQALLKAGVPCQGWLLAHQTTNLINGPRKPLPTCQTARTAGMVLRAVLWLLGGLGMLFVSAILLDPALILVLEDGTRVVVAQWYD